MALIDPPPPVCLTWVSVVWHWTWKDVSGQSDTTPPRGTNPTLYSVDPQRTVFRHPHTQHLVSGWSDGRTLATRVPVEYYWVYWSMGAYYGLLWTEESAEWM